MLYINSRNRDFLVTLLFTRQPDPFGSVKLPSRGLVQRHGDVVSVGDVTGNYMANIPDDNGDEARGMCLRGALKMLMLASSIQEGGKYFSRTPESR